MMGQPMGDGTGSIEEMAARMKALAGNMQQGGGMAQTVGGLSMQPPPGMRPGTPGPFMPDMTPDKFRPAAPPPPPMNPGIPPAGKPNMGSAPESIGPSGSPRPAAPGWTPPVDPKWEEFKRAQAQAKTGRWPTPPNVGRR